jgi:hypothetical protein
MNKLPKDAFIIATDKAKWDPNYQRKVSLKSGPAKIDEAMFRQIEHASKRVYRLLGLSGYAPRLPAYRQTTTLSTGGQSQSADRQE